MNTSITTAIEVATKNTRMVKVSPGSYEVQTYCPIRNAYIVGPTMDFYRARGVTTQYRHADALVAMGWDTDDALYESERVYGGTLRDRIKESLTK